MASKNVVELYARELSDFSHLRFCWVNESGDCVKDTAFVAAVACEMDMRVRGC
jgi:hypothetical protein